MSSAARLGWPLLWLTVALAIGLRTEASPAAWKTTVPMSTARSGACAVMARGWLYVLGGLHIQEGQRRFLATVEQARIQSNGMVDRWRPAPSLRTSRGFLTCLATEQAIYVMGGMTLETTDPTDPGRLLASVERARIGAHGQLGPWEAMPSLTTPRRGPVAVAGPRMLYVIGGYNGLFLRTVERSRIKDGGGLAPWEQLNDLLTSTRYIHGAAMAGGRLYTIGGKTREDGSAKSSVEWTEIHPDGGLGPWQETAALRTPRFLTSTAAVGSYLFVVGGYTGRYLASVERAKILEDGLGPWEEAPRLPHPLEGAALAVSEPYLYVLGGSNAGRYLASVLYATVQPDGTLGGPR